MEKYTAPLPPALVDELERFWQTIPELKTNERWRRELLGLDPSPNRLLVYLERRAGEIVASCQLWVSCRLPCLAEFNYPGTTPPFRGQGIAAALWSAALADAAASGVEAVFLGTFYPEAFRSYRRLGFSKLPASTTFLKALDGRSAEEFLVDWFRSVGSVAISPGEPEDQLPSYPLLVLPHDWQVLDANAGLFSTRYSLHRTFHGLFRKVDRMAGDGDGDWFSARGGDGRVVGFSTARLQSDGSCAVDGFVHRRFLSAWRPLLERAIDFADQHADGVVYARVSSEDLEKRQLLAGLGFVERGPAGEFILDALQLNPLRAMEPVSVAAIYMERDRPATPFPRRQ